jgi:hypothetical protein
MNTFSDLPRYPRELTGPSDHLARSEVAVRWAAILVRVAGQLLIVAAPVFGCLWLVVSLPVLLALIVVTAARDQHG